MLVRDGMLSDPVALAADASAQEAAEHLVRPEVRAVLVVDAGGALVGVVTPDALVEKVVAPGRDPKSTPLADVAVAPLLVIDAGLRSTRATGCSKRRRPNGRRWSRRGRLVGVLSRSVVQRRLAEDEPPAEVEDSGA